MNQVVLAQNKTEKKENASEYNQTEEAKRAGNVYKEEWPSIAKPSVP